MQHLEAFWNWATSRQALAIILAVVVAVVLITSFFTNDEQSLLDAVIQMFEILFGGQGQ